MNLSTNSRIHDVSRSFKQCTSIIVYGVRDRYAAHERLCHASD